jgi:hypothetical protein
MDEMRRKKEQKCKLKGGRVVLVGYEAKLHHVPQHKTGLPPQKLSQSSHRRGPAPRAITQLLLLACSSPVLSIIDSIVSE